VGRGGASTTLGAVTLLRLLTLRADDVPTRGGRSRQLCDGLLSSDADIAITVRKGERSP
jgi:hypothetical protein